jgi:hypothetical protein
MATTIKSSDLDFNTIKANLKSYFAQQAEFADYDFEASGLSNILDVLAYNTHINGLTANFALNEAFLNTAQLRSSVLSHAANLGYYPRSNTCSQAVVTVTANTSDTITGSATLPRFSSFTSTIDDVTYTFSTISETSALNDGSGGFTFKNPDGTSSIVIKEGVQKTKTFLVGNQSDNAVYVIPDTNVDTSTLVVRVFDNVNSQSFTEFADIRNAVNITPTSKVYIVREAPNGFYELIFSEGNVLGQAPIAGNQIIATYLSTKGATANNASSFTAANSISIGGTTYNLTVAKVSNSAGGADKESLDSIKLNAPTAFAAQQRMVTAEDYKTLIIGRYNNVLDDVIAWGGQDNIPATFGNVYVSLKFKTAIASNIQQETKDSIKSNFAANLSVMSIDTVFVDPTETHMEVNVKFDFDPDLSGDTVNSTQILIKNKVGEFFIANLGLFGRTFRRSALLTELDALSPAVLNSSATINLQRRISAPTDFQFNVSAPVSVEFPARLALPDDELHIISSSIFTFNGVLARLRNKLSSTTLEIVDVNTSGILNENAGSYDRLNGTVRLDDTFNISAHEGAFIKISATPDNQSTIKPLRSHVLLYDKDTSLSSGTIDTQNTLAVITT